MTANGTIKRQTDEFEKYLPTWTNEDATGFHRAHGEIVSAIARRAIPYGVTVKLATKTHSFGPMLLTPVVVEQLIQQLKQESRTTLADSP